MAEIRIHEIPEDIRDQLKIEAIRNNMSFNQYLIGLFSDELNRLREQRAIFVSNPNCPKFLGGREKEW